MRYTSFILALTIILPACSTTNFSGDSTAKRNNYSNEQVVQSVESRFKELETILQSHLEDRNLQQAKDLIWQLKFSLAKDHYRQKELLILDQWINESIANRKKIQSLEKQTRLLQSKFTQHKKALEQVRRSLVSD